MTELSLFKAVAYVVCPIGLSVIAAHAAVPVFDWLGYTSMRTVELVGGGETKTLHMRQSEYMAGPFVQLPVLVLTVGLLYIREMGVPLR